jgi:hypothetical protein
VKKLFAILVMAALAIYVYAQSPQKMSYQCVVRNSAGALVPNQAVGIKISILKGSATGTVVFSETYSPNPQTNANGLVTVEIGSGTASVGTFAGIDWSAGPYFLKTETDPAGGTSYTITGTSQLLSVPYALYAKTAANGFSGSYNDLTNKPVLFDGTWTSLTGKPSFATVATSGSYNDLLNRPTLFSGSYNDLTNKPVLFNGTWSSLTGKPTTLAGYGITDADGSITNEIQSLSLSGTLLTLSNGGGTVTLPSSGGGDNWGTQTVVTNTTLTGAGTTASPLAVVNTTITPSWSNIQGIPAGFADGIDNIDDADNSITNEIQALSLSGTVLSLSNGGGSVTLPSSGGGDNWGTQTVVTDATLAGNGTTATPLRIADNGVATVKIASAAVTADKLAASSVTSDKISAGAVTGAKIAQAGATTGQVLKWSGTTWAPAADATGGSSGGWTDDGTVVRLTATTDTVQIGSVNRLGKFNVGGDIGLNLLNSIYFGSDATRITSLTGGDLRFVAEDLSMLTTEDITFGHYGDETWIIFDNATKRVGIGTLSPTDRLHVVQSAATAGLSAIRGVATPTTVSNNGVYGESMSPTGYGLYGKSPKYGVYGTATGNQGRGVAGEATGTSSIGVYGVATNTSSTGVWGEGSNQGVYGYSSSTTGRGVYGRVTSPSGYSGYFEGGKFLVKGSAQIEDTLYASAVKIDNSPRVAYEKFSLARTITTLNSWGPLDTITLVAPGPGFVMLNFSGTLYTNHTYLEGTWVGIGIATSPTGGVLAQTWWEFEHQLVGGYYQSPCAVTTVATVTTGGTYRYYITGYHWGTSAEEDVVHLNYGSFSALFIPTP